MAVEEVGVRLTARDRRQFSREMDIARRDVDRLGDEADRADRQMRRAGDGVGFFSGSLRTLGRVAAVGVVALAAATAGVVAWGIEGYNALVRIETIAAQTNAVIESTGGVANVSASQIDAHAAAIERLTGVEAEAITEGQNLLLTFTNVRNQVGEGNNVFDRATEAMVNMSTALGTDASGSALQLGRALNDPIRGVTALTRAGVSFTQDQKDMIASLQESGDLLGAQGIILDELETQFGGSAAAFGSTTEGLTARIGNAYGEVQESIVAEFMPLTNRALEAIMGQIQGLAATSDQWLPRVSAAAERVADGFSNIGAQAPNLWDAIQAGDAQGIAEVLDNMAGNTGALVGPIRTAVEVFEDLWKIGSRVADVFVEVLDALPIGMVESIADVIGLVADNMETLKPLVTAVVGGFLAFRAVTLVVSTFTGAVALLNGVLAVNPIVLLVFWIAALVTGLIYAYNHSETFRGAVDALGDVIQAVVSWIARAAEAVAQWLVEIGALSAAQAIVAGIAAVFSTVAGWISTAVGHTTAFISAAWPTVVGAIGAIVAVATTLAGWIQSGVNAAGRFIGAAWPTVQSAIAGIQSVARGVGDAFARALGFLQSIMRAIGGAIDSAGRLRDSLSGGGGGGGGGFSGILDSLPGGNLVPGFASGGIVPATPGGKLVRVAEGGQAEAIIPLPRMAEIAPLFAPETVSGWAHGRNGATTIRVPVYLDGRLIAEAVVDSLDDELART